MPAGAAILDFPDAPAVEALEADIRAAICRRLWPDANCSPSEESPCGRCDAGARRAAACILRDYYARCITHAPLPTVVRTHG